MQPSSAARLDIDLSALLHNFRTLQARSGPAEIAPVVKADAYGLGAAVIAPHLARHGARTFFVARLTEGVALRPLVPGAVIYVLDGLTEPGTFAGYDLRPVLSTVEQYALWLSGPDTIQAALHIDTGMNRLGLRPEDATALPAASHHRLSLVMSHLACGDEPENPMNPAQLARFIAAADAFPGVPRSLANSSGAFLGDGYAFDLVRPGICLYGGGPFGTAIPEIRPVAHMTAPVLQVRHVPAGETIGYGAGFTAPHDLQIATLGIGYADGLLRSFAARGFATIAGQRRPLTGRISMDLCSLDVTGLDVTVGDRAEILGGQQTLDEVAAACGTIGYEVLTRLSSRLM